ncbi:MAG TPA: thiamine-phosphate kinase [Planctomycetota bacterium]|nr:thiamine-phosphate kinase [Planctomycetota bacterium]
MAERDFLQWIRRRLGRRGGGILVDSGDDAALVRIGRSDVLLKTDAVVDGVHVDRRTATPEQIGHKALARCLSDIAAMGGRPSFAVVAMMIPRGTKDDVLFRTFLGMERASRRFHVPIVGGDLGVYDGPLAITVSLTGTMGGRRPVLRSGARPGDWIGVTGALGGSILGKHLTFTPRLREGRRLAERGATAMIDISDGLAVDLHHLCQESGVGAVLDEAALPISSAARRLARQDRRSPLEHALSDGEDYELLYAMPPRKARTGIGRFVKGSGVALLRRDGTLVDLPPEGWEHRWS